MRNWKEWWIDAGTRAIKTVAQTAVATIGVAQVMSEVNWIAVGSASLLAGILSLLMSLTKLPEKKGEADDEESDPETYRLRDHSDRV